MMKRKKFQQQKSGKGRTILKTLSWRVIATLVTMSVVFFLTGQIIFAAEIGLLDTLIKLVLYYIHDRLWEIKSIV
jgi:uncharacterized membrane protein